MGKVVDYINGLSFEDEYVGIFGKRIPMGKMMCPFHDNTETPAAKYYPKSNCCYCFVCKRTYGTYDLLRRYNPQRIEDLKGSVIMDVEDKSSKQIGNLFVSIDRNDSIEKIVKDIVYGTGV